MINLTQDQEEALSEIKQFLNSDFKKEFILTGESGAGKSTLIEHLLEKLPEYMDAYNAVFGGNRFFIPELTATTNEAATVLSDMSSDKPAQTFFKLFGFFFQKNYQTGALDLVTYKAKRQVNKLIIIDEASMFSPEHRKAVLGNICPATKIIYVMDNEQLGVVKGVCPLMELGLPMAKLTSNNRNGGTDIASLGLEFRDAVISGVLPQLSFEDTKHIKYLSIPEFEAKIEQDFVINPVESTKIITYTNARTMHFNNLIRRQRDGTDRIQEGEVLITNNLISNGDSLVAKNNSEVTILTASDDDVEYMGVMGQIVKIEAGGQTMTGVVPTDKKKAKRIINKLAKEKNWSDFFALQDCIFDLRPRHASTTYKVQGKTLKSVYIDLDDISTCRSVKDIARTLYVAITRATETVYIGAS